MRYRLLLLVSILFTAFAERAQSQPAISGVAGSVTHGQSVTISGSGFGTKTPAAPLKWDDFSTGTPGQTVSNGWRTMSSSGNAPTYASSPLRSSRDTRSACANFPWTNESSNYTSSFGLTGALGNGLYMHAQYYLEMSGPSNAWSRNHKIIRLHANDEGQPNLYMAFWDPSVNTGWIVDQDGISAGGHTIWGSGSPTMNATYFRNKWSAIEFYLKQSTAGQANGSAMFQVDGRPFVAPSTSFASRDSGDPAWDTLWIGNYLSHDALSGQGGPYRYAARTCWASVYVDAGPYAQARVMLGNASTLAASQHKEIQIPSAWNGSSITATVNVGTFSTGSTAYLFVVDSNGVASPGRAITIGSGQPVCTTTATSTPLTFPVDGGTASVPVVASAPSCAWTSASDQLWLTPSSASATGSGQVTFTATSNPTAIARSGTVTVAGSTFPATQAGQAAPVCTFTVQPTSASVVATGSSGVLDLVASDPTCTWVASSTQTWLTAAPAAGTGSGQVTFTAAENTSTAARNAVLNIGPMFVPVAQAGTTGTGTGGQWCAKFVVVGSVLTMTEIPCSP